MALGNIRNICNFNTTFNIGAQNSVTSHNNVNNWKSVNNLSKKIRYHLFQDFKLLFPPDILLSFGQQCKIFNICQVTLKQNIWMILVFCAKLLLQERTWKLDTFGNLATNYLFKKNGFWCPVQWNPIIFSSPYSLT